MISQETQLNLASAARAILQRLPAEQGRPERWYVLFANERHSRVAAAFDLEGFLLLFATAEAARGWLESARPGLPVVHGGEEVNTVMLDGVRVDFEAAVMLMDDEIREALHNKLAPCTEQEFLDAYVQAHAAKYDGEEFKAA